MLAKNSIIAVIIVTTASLAASLTDKNPSFILSINSLPFARNSGPFSIISLTNFTKNSPILVIISGAASQSPLPKLVISSIPAFNISGAIVIIASTSFKTISPAFSRSIGIFSIKPLVKFLINSTPL